MITERDIKFSSDFMGEPIGKERKWMTRYFKTKTKKLFLKYFLSFGSTIRFREHCGEVCTKRYLKKMKRQFVMLSERHDEAKTNFDLDALERIEKGKWKLS